MKEYLCNIPQKLAKMFIILFCVMVIICVQDMAGQYSLHTLSGVRLDDTDTCNSNT